MAWSQEQRDEACILIFNKSGMPKSSVELSNVAMDVCIELACQRNELLEAVKRIMPQSLTGNPTLDVQREYWEYEMSQGRGEAEDVLFALAAIAKAEGK